MNPNQANEHSTCARHFKNVWHGTTPLFVAAEAGHADVVLLLLAHPGVDPNQANPATPPCPRPQENRRKNEAKRAAQSARNAEITAAFEARMKGGQ